MMEPRVILDCTPFQLTIDRLCHQLIENHDDFSGTCLIGVQPRGVYLSNRIYHRLTTKMEKCCLKHGLLDATFHRDDFRRRDKPIIPKDTTINFSIENQKVILVDDVLYTGRTIRSAMDALLDFGRPSHIELLVMVDRRFSRNVPVQPDYTGKTVDAITSEVVKVDWNETHGQDRIWIMVENENQ